MPAVAIVGRPNVGKSAIFNRLARRKIAIVHDQPGVTRDRLSAPCRLTKVPCEIIDTGGIGETLDDGLAARVALEADVAMQLADLILFVVDGQEGLTPADRDLAQKLRGTEKPLLLVVNKVDDLKHESAFGEVAALGLGPGIGISAEHGRNFGELIHEMDKHLEGHADPGGEAPREEGVRLAIVGKPNAGKSSLINAILNDERTIVSDIAGTTRDAVDLPYELEGEKFTLIDTAGLRQRGRRDTSVEVFSAMRTERSIRRADLCVLVIDLAAGVSVQDRKIVRLVLQERKPCLIVLNKFDLFHPGAPLRERLREAEEQVRRELFFLDYAPFLCVSAKERTAVGKVTRQVLAIRKAAQKIPSTSEMNRLLQAAFQERQPPAAMGRAKRLKLYYAAVIVSERHRLIPVPEYVLFVNDKALCTPAYEQYLVNWLRRKRPAPGIPLVLTLRSRRREER